jgi:hypothetical protein
MPSSDADRRLLGVVISDLVRRGFAPQPPRLDDELGFPVFRVPAGAPPITDEVVQRALADE